MRSGDGEEKKCSQPAVCLMIPIVSVASVCGYTAKPLGSSSLGYQTVAAPDAFVTSPPGCRCQAGKPGTGAGYPGQSEQPVVACETAKMYTVAVCVKDNINFWEVQAH